ncbi:DNA-directed RNA polymerase subunit beta [candidate division WOR-1 bacterium RIFOXYC2_FULL_37_10]|uniref:DNA-directed RNA polymerase subunit beta n=1 Tax=candidate division WOR-1 bacterium RIFOXYB2_FULL_37_13 TaxID=1802579 RepID=A0A1F4SRW6_UNCSA|nr:MAG: DNA-directed RNA polymerase subunit beta [candidate division WOR-1 bacterium RIFOXYB2_FULL_37_13]OGC35573.1 MAG: DNA-directed RNA polymerase subunit beta [candidate division WOR-1 bacterium RIFOXYC2_FULL_37_10]
MRESLFEDARIRIPEPPDLLELQKDSFAWFMNEGLRDELRAMSPIKSYDGVLELFFTGKILVDKPKYSERDCLVREVTYAAPLRVEVKLVNRKNKEVKVQEVFIGDLPLMTERATFIINGAERVIISQLTRSPGVYFKSSKRVEKIGRHLYYATIIPDRGSWLEIETDSHFAVFARINKTRKIGITTLLCAIGATEKEILSALAEGEFRNRTLKESPIISEEEALIEIYKKLRPGDPVTFDGAKNYLYNLFFNAKRYDLGRVGRHKMNIKLNIKVDENIMVLTKEDILGMTKYLIQLHMGEGLTDDIDHLGNRRIRSVGELLQRQFRIGFTRIERLIKEQMTIKGPSATPQALINIRPLSAVIKEFFGSSQLSQFMDQTNPLAELTHKRRLSALGPGGLTRERAGFEVRDIHPSHYGRICPIETPEGPNAGLIGSLSTYARVNKYGFIETPYFKVANGIVTNKIEYLTADVEDLFRIASCDVGLDPSRHIKEKQVPVRYKREFVFASSKEVDYLTVAPSQIIGVSTAMIPFVEHDDANRAMMGANMQRQSVPLLKPEAPIVGTGLEAKIAEDSYSIVRAKSSGKVSSVTANSIEVTTNGGEKEVYDLIKFSRSNQNTLIHQRPVVSVGDKVSEKDFLADGSATEGGELALGKNILVAFMPWEGYNYEDAILISERLVRDDVFTSVHIERMEVEVRSTKLGMEEITREIPNIGEEALKNLDERGIIRVGTEVQAGHILVGKVTPKGETELPAEEKLLRAIFGDKARDMRDTSLRVPPGEGGKVIDIRVFSREKGDELSPGVHELIRVYIAQIRKVSIGDKLAGRHGNKGVIAKILKDEDMPYLPDGTPIDIVLNPLGVPSRMNIGQIYEFLLGFAADHFKKKYKLPSFDEIYGEGASKNKVEELLGKVKEDLPWFDVSGKVQLRDGRSGDPFDRKVAVGKMYLMKLIHLVDDKMHARSTGPYSLITQQPLGGKAQFGGQRFGEMEVWALEAYGAAHTLQELLTVKSDDVVGRSRVYESIIKGKPMGQPGTPESFKVLIKELRSLALDVKTLDKNGKEVSIEEDSKAGKQAVRKKRRTE